MQKTNIFSAHVDAFADQQNSSHSFNNQELEACFEVLSIGLMMIREDGAIAQNPTAHALSTQLPISTLQHIGTILQPGGTDFAEQVVLDNGEQLLVECQRLETAEGAIALALLINLSQKARAIALAEADRWALTPRQTEVWEQRRQGKTRKEIARALYISPETVKKHLVGIASQIEQWFFLREKNEPSGREIAPIVPPCDFAQPFFLEDGYR